MNVFKKLWREGWFNPELDINLTLEDIDISRLKKEKRLVVRKDGRTFTGSIPEDKSVNELEGSDVSIYEIPGVEP